MRFPSLSSLFWRRQRSAPVVTSRRPRPKREKKAPKLPRKWRYEGMTCYSQTKSEARSIFKYMAGVKRLPAGAVVAEV